MIIYLVFIAIGLRENTNKLKKKNKMKAVKGEKMTGLKF